MPKSILLMLAAMFALAACDGAKNIDEDRLERENREILRQLGGD